MKKSNMEECFSSIEIRKQGMTTCVENTVKEYAHYAAHLTIVECSFETTLIEIINYVEEYIKEHNEKPVVIIDYLQVICARDHRMSTREVIDEHVRGLKQLQKNNELILLVISSLNRQNYTTAIDFESFKESGGIEYTADVLWGLQLDILHSKGFDKLTSEEKKEKIKEANLESPRQIELVCVKNRSGQSRYSCLFNYYPEHDLYLPDGDDIWFDMLDDLEFPFK